MHVHSCVHSQSWQIWCEPIDYSTPGSSAHRISSGKSTGVGYHFLLQGIFLTQGSNLHLLQWQADSLPLSHQGSLTVSLDFSTM